MNPDSEEPANDTALDRPFDLLRHWRHHRGGSEAGSLPRKIALWLAP
jgi:hypothetical protein